MLCNIDDHLIEDARRILTLLCFAARPLTVPELIDGIAVEIEGSIGLNPKIAYRIPTTFVRFVLVLSISVLMLIKPEKLTTRKT